MIPRHLLLLALITLMCLLHAPAADAAKVSPRPPSLPWGISRSDPRSPCPQKKKKLRKITLQSPEECLASVTQGDHIKVRPTARPAATPLAARPPTLPLHPAART